jgi:hypothetical protein
MSQNPVSGQFFRVIPQPSRKGPLISSAAWSWCLWNPFGEAALTSLQNRMAKDLWIRADKRI